MSPRTGIILLLCIAGVTLAAGVVGVDARAAPKQFDVTEWGAVGDGQTDNTGAIAKVVIAMIDSLQDGDAELYFPPGNYRLATLSSPLSVVAAFINFDLTTPVNGSITIAGSPTGQSVISFDATCASAIQIFIHTEDGVTSVPGSIHDLAFETIDQAYPQRPNNYVIMLYNTVDWTIEHVNIIGQSQTGANGLYLTGCESLVVQDVSAVNLQAGIVVWSGSDVRFEQVTLSALDDLSIAVNHFGLELQQTTNAEVRQVNIGRFGYGLVIYATTDSDTAAVITVTEVTFQALLSNLVVEALANVTVTGSTFDGTNVPVNLQGPGTPTGISTSAAYTSGPTLPATGSFITIESSLFQSLVAGVNATTGTFRVDQCTFRSNQNGVVADAPVSPSGAAPVATPLTLTNNAFDQESVLSISIATTSFGGFLIQGNTCESSGPIQYAACLDCTVGNNPGCTLEPDQQRISIF